MDATCSTSCTSGKAAVNNLGYPNWNNVKQHLMYLAGIISSLSVLLDTVCMGVPEYKHGYCRK